MNFIRTGIREFVGLFVDDWLFTILLLAWIGAIALGRGHVDSGTLAVAFFAGVALLTLAFVVRRAKLLAPRPQAPNVEAKRSASAPTADA
ncbi:MAG: hypothetical protein ACYC96_10555 [Fimbriimonadaceae bacterium]